VHSECLTGDILGSLRCDCGAQLEQALRAIAAEGCGAVVYLRGHEGRGIGLGHKMRAYALQDEGWTPWTRTPRKDCSWTPGATASAPKIVSHLGIRRIRLITNNPAKYGGLEGYGLELVGRVVLPTVPTSHKVRYLRTKRERMQHVLDDGLLGETGAANVGAGGPRRLLKRGSSDGGIGGTKSPAPP